MYNVVVPVDVYMSWVCYRDWWDDTGHLMFEGWVMNRYPEVLGVKWVPPSNTSREFIFESEEHYNWFLLKQ